MLVTLGSPVWCGASAGLRLCKLAKLASPPSGLEVVDACHMLTPGSHPPSPTNAASTPPSPLPPPPPPPSGTNSARAGKPGMWAVSETTPCWLYFTIAGREAAAVPVVAPTAAAAAAAAGVSTWDALSGPLMRGACRLTTVGVARLVASTKSACICAACFTASCWRKDTAARRISASLGGAMSGGLPSRRGCTATGTALAVATLLCAPASCSAPLPRSRTRCTASVGDTRALLPMSAVVPLPCPPGVCSPSTTAGVACADDGRTRVWRRARAAWVAVEVSSARPPGGVGAVPAGIRARADTGRRRRGRWGPWLVATRTTTLSSSSAVVAPPSASPPSRGPSGGGVTEGNRPSAELCAKPRRGEPVTRATSVSGSSTVPPEIRAPPRGEFVDTAIVAPRSTSCSPDKTTGGVLPGALVAAASRRMVGSDAFMDEAGGVVSRESRRMFSARKVTSLSGPRCRCCESLPSTRLCSSRHGDRSQGEHR